MYYVCTMFVQCMSLYVYVSMCLRVYLSIYLSICLAIYLPTYLSIYLPVCPSVRLFVRPSVCVSLSLSPWSLVKSKLWCIYLIYQSTVIQSIPLQFYISIQPIQQYAYQSQATVSITPQGVSACPCMPLCQSPRRLPVAALLASLHAIAEAHHVWTPVLANGDVMSHGKPAINQPKDCSDFGDGLALGLPQLYTQTSHETSVVLYIWMVISCIVRFPGKDYNNPQCIG